MRIASFEIEGHPSVGLVTNRGIVDLRRHQGIDSLKVLLRKGPLDQLSKFHSISPDYEINDVSFLPLIPDVEQFFCVGANYKEHVKEAEALGVQRPPPKGPALFLRVPQSLCGHRQPLVRPRVSEQLDYECELAVIIGRSARHVPKQRAFEYVAGYACFNDGSVRDWQQHTTQITSGKNFSATGGFGPWLVTRDEFANPPDLDIKTKLNGEVLQQANTRDMIFDIPAVIAYVSAMLELRPGDVIATGTCSGVGIARKPQVWLKPGDVVEVEIEKVGTLVNPIAAEHIAAEKDRPIETAN